jgi:gamma-tubulin complex component 2
VHFLDAAEDELYKDYKQISQEKLQSLLEISIRTSSADTDPYKDDVNCYLTSYTPHQVVHSVQTKEFKDNYQMLEACVQNYSDNKNFVGTNIKGYEIFTMNYKVKWPLNLILSKKCMIKYQVLFRHIFNCRFTERALCKTWL